MTSALIKDAMHKALAAHLVPANIVALTLHEEHDSDGDPILRVLAVYDPEQPAPSAEEMFSATGIVRSLLVAHGDSRFPLLSFISRADIQEAAA
jgi:hypothetical protein